uniref:DRBM domain-containing protein n=1 Tax=Tetraselmis sp. GSL018 TaxID=582737 RepID=A0A061QNJ7_9CHLO
MDGFSSQYSNGRAVPLQSLFGDMQRKRNAEGATASRTAAYPLLPPEPAPSKEFKEFIWHSGKTAKSSLHEFYQLTDQQPVFDVSDSTGSNPEMGLAPSFYCLLRCPEVRSFPESTFEGCGRSKKAAEHSAAEQALEALCRAGLCKKQAAPPPTPSAPAQEAQPGSLLPLPSVQPSPSCGGHAAMAEPAAWASGVPQEQEQALLADPQQLLAKYREATEDCARLRSALEEERRERQREQRAFIECVKFLTAATQQ